MNICRIFILVLAFFLQFQTGYGQFYRFRQMYHLYGTNQKEAFLFELRKMEEYYNLQHERAPDAIDEGGNRVMDKIFIGKELTTYNESFPMVTFQKIIFKDKEGIYIVGDYFDQLSKEDFSNNPEQIEKYVNNSHYKTGWSYSYSKDTESYSKFNGKIIKYEDGKGAFIMFTYYGRNPNGDDYGLVTFEIPESFFHDYTTNMSYSEGTYSISVSERNGVFYIPIVIGGKSQSYIIDSGASDMSISELLYPSLTLQMQTGAG